MASSGNQFKLWAARAPALSGAFIANASGFGDTTFSDRPPVAASTFLYRSFQLTADEGDIGLAEECCPPRSPKPTSWLVGGPDAGDFEQSPTNAGYIRMTAACMAAGVRKNRTLYLTPISTTGGSGRVVTLEVRQVAQANERFVAASAANQSGNGQTPATAYKYLPGSADYTGSAVSWGSGAGADIVVFFKGEVHRTTWWTNKTDINSSRLNHSGTQDHPIIKEGSAWGSGLRAEMNGTVAITGGSTPTQVQVGGNTNYASFTRFTGLTYIEYFQMLFAGSTQCYVAQWPAPSDLRVNEQVDYVSASGSELYGTRNYTVGSSGTRHIQMINSNTQIEIVEPDLAALFGNVTAASLGPLTAIVRNTSNFFQGTGALASYNYATSTFVFAYTGTISNSDGFGSVGFLNHPLFMVKAGQYVVDATRTQVDAWLPNASTVAISRLYGAWFWGDSGYSGIRGFTMRGYSSGTLSDPANLGADRAAGVVYWYSSTDVHYQGNVTNVWFLQNNNDGGNGVIHSKRGTNNQVGLRDSNITLCYFEENNRCSGIRLTAMFKGFTGTLGDYTSLESYGQGQITFCSWGDYGCGQTLIYGECVQGALIADCIMINCSSIHGNVISLYDGTSAPLIFNQNVKITRITAINCSRFFTNNVNRAGALYFYVGDCLFTNAEHVFDAVQCNGDSDGVHFTRIFGMGHGSTYNYSTVMNFRAGGATMELDHCVLAGSVSSVGTAWQGNVHDTLFTINSVPANSSLGGTKTNLTIYTGTPNAQVYYWDLTTIPAAFQTALGAGQLGALHTI